MSQSPKQPPEELPAAFGRYRLDKLLGQGGMGTVYLAHDTQLDRPVALKIPQLNAASGSKVLARFYTEAKAAAALNHPNICPIHDVGESDGLPYLTMAFLEGKPLNDFVRGRSLLPRQSALLVRKLALALHEAHKRGVIHRDLKPANIMIDKRGEPIIMDFGLARRTGKGDARLTQVGSAMGTPAYMPPEQVQGDTEAMGPASDIYSLGVILYELLAGRLPFSGDVMAVLSQVLLDEPPLPSRFRPDLEPELEAICMNAMAKKVEDRYASMADLAAALADHLRHKPGTPEPAQPTPVPASPASPTLSPAKAEQAENEAPAAGMRTSYMGGLRSVAQLHAQLPAAMKADSPRPQQRRQTRGRVPWWVWVGTGTVLLLLTGWLVYRATDRGTLRIAVVPAAAAVTIEVDGKPGHQAGEVIGLPTGPHHLAVIAKDYESEDQTFTVRRGPNPDLQVKLRPKEVKPESRLPQSSGKTPEPEPPQPAGTAPEPRPPQPSASAPTVNILDDIVEKYLAKVGSSAAVLAVDRNGVPWHVKAFGFRNKTRTLPTRPDNLFLVPEHMWLWAATRQLAEKKRLSLNDTLFKRLELVPRTKLPDPRLLEITIAHVLEEKTGWDDDLVRSVKTVLAQRLKREATTVEVLSVLTTQPLKEAPGAKLQKCGFCLEVLALLIAKVTGRPPVDYFRNELLGREEPGIAVPGTPVAQQTAVWNVKKSGTLLASAPAALEFMRHFSWNGVPGRGGAGHWDWIVGDLSQSHWIWRADGIRLVVLFNGSGNVDGKEIRAELNKAITTLKAGLPK